jgi:hypothetical protein
MTSSFKSEVPLFHVQSTGEFLRGAFPYFAHHDSVSALWSQKWRTPCTRGIYPFTDGRVEDFDPIFDALVKMSGDRTDILFRPDDYARLFLAVAESLVAQAGEADTSGQPEKARELYLRAAAVYRISRFPVNRTPVSESSWHSGKAAYIKGAHYLDPPILPIDIPFTHADPANGDRAESIQAFLHMPVGVVPESGWPVLLFICGLDAYRTDNTSRTLEHVRRGFATILFEIPGTGDCPASPSDANAPDRLMSSVLDWVVENSGTYHFHLGRICARGISTGGYYAMRLAHTHADRLFAVASQGGGCHHMFDPVWIQAQNQMEYPFALADALAYKFGFRGSDPVHEYMNGAAKFSLLQAGVFDRPNCKLALINGLEDSIFPIEDNLICGLKGKNKSLWLRGNTSHMGNPGGEDLVYEFLDQAIRDLS